MERIEIVAEHIYIGNRHVPPGTLVDVAEIGELTAQMFIEAGVAKPVKEKGNG